MSKLIFTLLIAHICFTTLLSADHEDAKELFSDAECMSCHNSQDFSPKQKCKIIKNFIKL